MITAINRSGTEVLRVGMVGALVAVVALASPVAQSKDRASKSESVGVATGFTVGAAAGGPIGAIVGAAAGAWLGDRHHRQRQSIVALRGEVANSSFHSAQLATEVEWLSTTVAALEHGATQVGGVVQFRTGETGVRDEDRARLERLAGWLMQYDGIDVRITGYADPRGPAALNQALSQERAETVARILQASGVSPARLRVTGVGASPVDETHATLDDYAFERRVQIDLEPAAAAVARNE
ncbi:MAG: OmpA family protein [Steroidobacteraceae bacterium]